MNVGLLGDDLEICTMIIVIDFSSIRSCARDYRFRKRLSRLIYPTFPHREHKRLSLSLSLSLSKRRDPRPLVILARGTDT